MHARISKCAVAIHKQPVFKSKKKERKKKRRRKKEEKKKRKEKTAAANESLNNCKLFLPKCSSRTKVSCGEREYEHNMEH